jgi:dienelactone hydrolase
LPKMQNNRTIYTKFWLQLIFSLGIMLLGVISFAQSEKITITYYSSDGLLITADEYLTSDTLAYVILFHDQGSSRGEFSDIAHRFQKMNFNCLAVDIRNGGNTNFLANETAKRCRAEGFNRSVNDIEEDIEASLKYAFEKSGEQVILLGAGANGSLAMKIAKENNFVKASIALSPGEYFQPYLSIEDAIAGIQKPILITASKMEFSYQEKILSKVSNDYKTIYAPEGHEGARGTNALLSDNESSGDYWLALLLFFKDLQ